MTRDDIIRMAREAGWSEIGADLWGATNDGAMSIYALERFFKLAYEAGAAAEREACAIAGGAAADAGLDVAAAIRARGQA
jgi:hypothetical protein